MSSSESKPSPPPRTQGSGGTEGGVGQFFLGFGLAVLATYLFFDSVRASTEVHGVFTGMLRGRGAGGVWETTSMGILFVPFFLGVTALFYNARLRWAWVLMWLGVGIIAIEILSRIRFRMEMKTSHLLGMLVLLGAGVGLMLRSYREHGASLLDDQPPLKDDRESQAPESRVQAPRHDSEPGGRP